MCNHFGVPLAQLCVFASSALALNWGLGFGLFYVNGKLADEGLHKKQVRYCPCSSKYVTH